jgi:hypothetical protein
MRRKAKALEFDIGLIPRNVIVRLEVKGMVEVLAERIRTHANAKGLMGKVAQHSYFSRIGCTVGRMERKGRIFHLIHHLSAYTSGIRGEIENNTYFSLWLLGVGFENKADVNKENKEIAHAATNIY